MAALQSPIRILSINARMRYGAIVALLQKMGIPAENSLQNILRERWSVKADEARKACGILKFDEVRLKAKRKRCTW